MDSLDEKILEILSASTQSLRAKEIAKKLRMHSHLFYTKQDINARLYKSLRQYVLRDVSTHSWSIQIEARSKVLQLNPNNEITQQQNALAPAVALISYKAPIPAIVVETPEKMNTRPPLGYGSIVDYQQAWEKLRRKPDSVDPEFIMPFTSLTVKVIEPRSAQKELPLIVKQNWNVSPYARTPYNSPTNVILWHNLGWTDQDYDSTSTESIALIVKHNIKKLAYKQRNPTVPILENHIHEFIVQRYYQPQAQRFSPESEEKNAELSSMQSNLESDELISSIYIGFQEEKIPAAAQYDEVADNFVHAYQLHLMTGNSYFFGKRLRDW